MNDDNDDDKMKVKKLRPGEPNRTRHKEGYVPLHSFLGDVASPVSIKARSSLYN